MIRAVLKSVLAAAFLVFGSPQTHAQGFGALARLVPDQSQITAGEGHIDLRLGISQAVPFRVFTLADPYRVVVDFREVQFGDWAETQVPPFAIDRLQTGPAREAGWSRLVLTLNAPFLPEVAAMRTEANSGRAEVRISLAVATDSAFRETVRPPDMASMPHVTVPERPQAGRAERVTIVLDPGHGGVDPGAVRGEATEADLVLTFSRELRDALRRTGLVDVVMTRDADMFVPLPTRVTLARAAEADAFISIHADALAEGRARGATVYTLSETASDAAAAALAEQHDRADLLAGIDLHGADDVVAGVLMDLARLETAPRGHALADELVSEIGDAGLRLHSRPRGEAGFTVLRAADIPSILVEIGFMSDERDLANIQSPEWRAEMQAAVVAAIIEWAETDAARMALARQ